MCQIGAIANIQSEGPEAAKLIDEATRIMLKEMAIGNTHGSGIAVAYQNDKAIYTLKSGNDGGVLAETLILDKTNPFRHILLHTRWATQGKINNINSHPHMGPTGALVHNGWCPSLYKSIKEGWHHKASELSKSLKDMNGKPEFASECDSEALSLVFSTDVEKFSENLLGDEVFALAHIDHSGDTVTLFTQYNTVHMAYSHALKAVVFATQARVVKAVLDYLGEEWPIAKVDSDKVYYFTGQDINGGDFDFDKAVMNNEEKAGYYSSFVKEASSSDKSLMDHGWVKKEFKDGSVIWEQVESGEIIEKIAKNDSGAEMGKYNDNDMEDIDLDAQYLRAMQDCADDDECGELGGTYLRQEEEAAQTLIHQQIKDEAKKKRKKS